MPLASITEQLVTFATHVVRDLGLGGIFLLMLLESACIPIPSEATMLFAGFDVSAGHWSLLTITAAGVLGNLVGSLIAYAVGYYGRVEVLERHGGKLHISSAQLHRADRWFARYGAPTVLLTRTLPIVRTFISLPAGVARMPLLRFSVLTLIGCIPWVFALALIGQQVGHHSTQWKDHLHYLDYAVLALVILGAAYLLLRNRIGRQTADEPSNVA
jgi:membrane protein DedA with SNARE-associated domain